MKYSRRNHSGEWLLVEFAVQAQKRIAIERTEIHLLTSDERAIPLASQQEFLDGHDMLNGLLQNAAVWRRSMTSVLHRQTAADDPLLHVSRPERARLLRDES